MAASAADVRNILSIAGPSQPKKLAPTPTTTSKKPEGISRELYSLIGPSAPSLAAQLAKPRLKQKPNLGGGGKVRWEWRRFKNFARSDSLELGHWTKASTDPNSEYPFAHYNTKQPVYIYSQDEYTRMLEDDQWTKEETDYLFKLVTEYDLRWYIILDRYEYPTNSTGLRTLEDLKDRYFSVCRQLVRHRPWSSDEATKAALLSQLSFNKDNEVRRKRYIESLDSRSAEQIAEEEALFIELKRLEQTERRFKKDREDLLRKLAGIDSGLPDVVEDEAGPLSLIIDTKSNSKKKHRHGTIDSDTASIPSTTPSSRRAPPVQVTRNAAYDAQHCIIRTELPPTTPATKAAHTPAYLRSYKIPAPKAAIAPKIAQALAELGISHTRLVIPTKSTCDRLDALLEATMTLVETKKVTDRIDFEIKVLKERMGLREGEQTNGVVPIAFSDAMDVDTSTEVSGRPRSASVRSRAQTRRSMSASSVDTSATASTRAGNKRKRT